MEKHSRGIWKYKYCIEKQHPLVYPPSGLGVYQHKVDDFGRDFNPLAEEYHHDTVNGFYNLLHGPEVVLETQR
jgi:hypothetical protein